MSRNYSSTATEKTLAANVTTSGTSSTQITLSDSTGLPSVPFILVLNPDTSIEEVVLVNADQTGVTPPTYKVTRAQDNTTIQTHSIGQVVKHMIVGSDLQAISTHSDATAAHGASGAVVGTTNTQTLTNKTLTAPTITSPVINAGNTLTATSTELNKLTGVTATTTEINKLAGLTATTAELNKLAGTPAGLTSTELGYVDGVTSSIQTQLDAKQAASTNGLVLVKTQNISGSGVTSVTVSNAFNTNYENYKIIITGCAFSTTSYIKLTLGSVVTNYFQGILGVGYSGVYSDFNMPSTNFYVADSNADFITDITLYGPFTTRWTGIHVSSSDFRNTTGGWGFNMWGICQSSTSHTDFTMTTNAGTIAGGTIYIYGYKK